MSKSRYSKRNATGQMVGLTRYGMEFKQQSRLVPTENRQMRRAKEKGSRNASN